MSSDRSFNSRVAPIISFWVIVILFCTGVSGLATASLDEGETGSISVIPYSVLARLALAETPPADHIGPLLFQGVAPTGREGTIGGNPNPLLLPSFQLGGYSVISIDGALVAAGTAANGIFQTDQDENLEYFASFAELAGYVPEYSYRQFGISICGDFLFDGDTDSLRSVALFKSNEYSLSYSGTNNQEGGVDEADTVKTDGRYIYLKSNDHIFIVQAYPAADARVVAKIDSEGKFIRGIFIDQDRLVILRDTSSTTEIKYHQEEWAWDNQTKQYVSQITGIGNRTVSEPRTEIIIYDITMKDRPMLIDSTVVSGSYRGARLIGGDLYLITSHRLYRYQEQINWPVFIEDGNTWALDHTRIGYFDDSKGSSQLTIVTAMNVRRGKLTDSQPILTSSSSKIYVSRSGIYLAGVDYNDRYRIGGSFIHKFVIGQGQISYVGMGLVSGYIKNQFSMDEHEDHLRVATSFGRSSNSVYILDGKMNTVGKLEGLAPGEWIYSARFMGDRGYLVTFKKVDPFFVIDLSNPTDPIMLGYLKIPGFSEYMHPYDENHVIGLGKDTVEGQGGNFAWFQGLKLSLFDVTDVAHPLEVSKLVIGDRGTNSQALYDHKSFQFFGAYDKIVLPVNLYERQNGNGRDNQYGEFVWQGAYVISVTPEDGFQIGGRISHDPRQSEPTYSIVIHRSLYIEEVLYTISDNKVRLNNIHNLNGLGVVKLD